MRIKYSQKLYLWIVISFVLIASISIFFILNEEKRLKTEVIRSDQVVYANLIKQYTNTNNIGKENIDSLSRLISSFPSEVPILIIDKEGEVIYHNLPELTEPARNQKNQVEVKRALLQGMGWSRRISDITSKEYVYYALYNPEKEFIIRIGFPYNDNLETFFSPNRPFIIFLVIAFTALFILFFILHNNYRNLIKSLSEYVISLGKNRKTLPSEKLQDELKDIAYTIKDVYNQIEAGKIEIIHEREKLLQHFQYSEEGIGFFTEDYEKLYTNAYFIQYMNILLNKPTFDVQSLFKNSIFEEIVRFINNPGDKDEFSSKIRGNGKHFFMRVIIFEDRSFEVIVRDITREEQIIYDKSQMTNNIAHELKTPITSIRGYLESIIEYKNMSDERKNSFIDRAYKQTIRLTEIVQDVILLSKITEGSQYFEKVDVNLYDLLHKQVKEDCMELIQERKYSIEFNIKPKTSVKGNPTLLYSLFFNLGTNSLKYAGEGSTITIDNYMEDEHYYYFSFADNGIGVEEDRLTHLFERFYRVTEGRTRNTGGSGLGLAIVQDAVKFHGGTIMAKNRTGGGLEFLFTLRKA